MTQASENRKRCFLGMPGYGDVSAGAARTFYRATAGGLLVRREYAEGSLLTKNMNKLWCGALNDARHHGLEFFAMQHSDVQAEDFWLDALVAEIEARDLDVLGVVVPIKDTRGLTSTALARPDGDNWRPHARLTLSEVYRLPETFTSSDVGFPLLLNTGLWVCRFREEWARKIFFTVNDRIMLNPKGDYEAQEEPEDWFVSRLFHELGLKVGCTRKIAVAHHGHTHFENMNVWGDWSYDREALAESPIPRTNWFPADVAGWLTEAEGAELAELAAGKHILEIGSYCGRSTICLAQKAISVHAVDTFDGRATDLPGNTLRTFQENVRRFGVGDRVSPVKGTSSQVVPGLPQVFDVVFIDGAHDYESVRTDTRLAISVLKPGGLLAFHDYRKFPGEADGRWDPGVTRAVDELLSGGADLLRRIDSLAVIRPAAAETLVNVGA